MLLTRHWLAIPKAEAKFKLNVLITIKRFNKPTEFGNWIVQNSEKNKQIVSCATMSIKVELTVLFTAWIRSQNILRRFEIFSLPSISLEFILVTKLGAACKPHVQSYIWKSKQQILARKSLHSKKSIPNIQMLQTYSLSFALHFNSSGVVCNVIHKGCKKNLKSKN